MTDNQIDKLKEIESIAELMMIASDSLSEESLQRLGEQILNKCKKIESINK